MKGAFVVNKYYHDEGMEYVFQALKREFTALGVEIIKSSPNLIYNGNFIDLVGMDAVDFVIFWDKNVNLAYQIQNSGIKVFNSPQSIAICDDKQLTYSEIFAKNNQISSSNPTATKTSLTTLTSTPITTPILIPKTISAPKMYDNCSKIDYDFIDLLEEQLKYPIVAKENTGSQGRQVFLATDRVQLIELYGQLKHTNHHYQALTGTYGEDLRLYMVGGEMVASYTRKGTGFKSNLFGGNSSAERAEPSQKTVDLAKRICQNLGLDFGSMDFLIQDNHPIFLEANSSAYFMGAEKLGYIVAKNIANHVLNSLNKST